MIFVAFGFRPIFRGELLVSGRVYIYIYTYLYLEAICEPFVLPPKEGLTSNQNKGHQRVPGIYMVPYIYILYE